MVTLTEWGVVGVVVTLVGLIGVFVKLTYSLSSILQKLSSAVDQLGKTVDKMDNSNAKTHQRIFTQLVEHDDMLQEHDLKLALLEKKEKNNER